ncbi:hypothetical protein SBA3_2350013 [Candidatus Sulfopaludibacter sp. SbA3]|nr:hypothetical protein SBA3_2350013 [Candidatus Sulfopaludibacter sp. SbA3]
MQDEPKGRGNSFTRIWQFLKRQIVDTAPDDLAICQFDCHKGQCLQNEWESCDRRIQKGAGEFFPDPRVAKPTYAEKAEHLAGETTANGKGKVG